MVFSHKPALLNFFLEWIKYYFEAKNNYHNMLSS